MRKQPKRKPLKLKLFEIKPKRPKTLKELKEYFNALALRISRETDSVGFSISLGRIYAKLEPECQRACLLSLYEIFNDTEFISEQLENISTKAIQEANRHSPPPRHYSGHQPPRIA